MFIVLFQLYLNTMTDNTAQKTLFIFHTIWVKNMCRFFTF